MKKRELVAKLLCVLTILLLSSSIFYSTLVLFQNTKYNTTQKDSDQKQFKYNKKVTLNLGNCLFENELLEELDELEKDFTFDLKENFNFFKNYTLEIAKTQKFIVTKGKLLSLNIPNWLKNRQILI